MAIFNAELINESLNKIPNYLESVQESNHGDIGINQLSIQIMAETAYNEVLVNNFINESISVDIINEGFFDNIKSICNAIIGAIKKFWEKVKELFGKLIKKSKEKESKEKEFEKKQKDTKFNSNSTKDEKTFTPFKYINYHEINFDFDFESGFNAAEILKTFTDEDGDKTKRNSKTQDFVKLGAGKLWNKMTVDEYTIKAFKDTIDKCFGSSTSFKSLYNKIKDMDDKTAIINEVKNMESYISSEEIKTIDQLRKKYKEVPFIIRLSSFLQLAYEQQNKVLNNQIKQIENMKKTLERWCKGGEESEKEIGVDRVNHFKTKQAAINKSLDTLSGCVNSILTLFGAMNAAIVRIENNEKKQEKEFRKLFFKVMYDQDIDF